MSIAALIPALDPGKVVIDVVKKTLAEVDHVILVNDGCDEQNTAFLIQLNDSSTDITLIEHPKNLGKGYAIQSGLTEALKQGHEHVVMLDSDGQHDPAEIQLFKDKITTSASTFVIGTRTKIANMPFKSKLGNVTMAWTFSVMTGEKLIDTQSGFRALSKSFIKIFLANCKPGRYETEMKMLLLAAKESKTIDQVAINTIYIDENCNSKFKPVQDSIRVLSSFISFIGVGLLSFLVDYGLFLGLTLIGNSYFLNAHLLSRLVGSGFNYFTNQHYEYNHKDAKALTAYKYISTALVSMLISSILLYVFVVMLAMSIMWAKPIAELMTLFINVFVLRHFVFQNISTHK